MKTFWDIFSYVLSTGIGGLLFDFFTKRNQSITDKKIRAINSGMQINNISNLLDKSAYSPDNSKHSKSDSKHLKADLIYLNFWSEYINQQLIDYNVMYHNAHNSLHDIDAILQLLLDKNISKRCKQQIRNYQNAYNTIVSKQKK